MTAIAIPDTGFQILLLGDMQVRRNGKPVVGLSYARMRALLAYLAVEREREHQREALADLLWAGTNALTARGNLRRTLADLRRALEVPSGDALFSSSRDSIRIVAHAYVDVLDFTTPVQHNEERNFYALERLWKDCPTIEVPGLGQHPAPESEQSLQ